MVVIINKECMPGFRDDNAVHWIYNANQKNKTTNITLFFSRPVIICDSRKKTPALVTKSRRRIQATSSHTFPNHSFFLSHAKHP
jgi:hypothetical protein